ncbi:hypothetical protein D3C75_781840 [compost metagenome]
MNLPRIKLDVPRRAEIIGADCVDEQIIKRINTAQCEQAEKRVDDSLEQGIAWLQFLAQWNHPLNNGFIPYSFRQRVGCEQQRYTDDRLQHADGCSEREIVGKGNIVHI